jgi:hypothetical protein
MYTQNLFHVLLNDILINTKHWQGKLHKITHLLIFLKLFYYIFVTDILIGISCIGWDINLHQWIYVSKKCILVQYRTWRWQHVDLNTWLPILSCLTLNIDLHSSYVYVRQLDQYSENNVVHFLFNLLRIKDLYMFRDTSSTPFLVQPTDITRTQHTKCRLCRTSWR